MGDTLSWAAADTACQAAGLQLASVQSAAQNALLLTAASGYEVWMGGTDAASEGTWVWSPSNTPLSYTNWCQTACPGTNGNEPNDYGSGEDCMQLRSTGAWNDNNCAKTLKYVCQTACPVPPLPPPQLPPSPPSPPSPPPPSPPP
eukprot:scaffold121577_cov30-Phaeocystis_antarctica.AAC.1